MIGLERRPTSAANPAQKSADGKSRRRKIQRQDRAPGKNPALPRGHRCHLPRRCTALKRSIRRRSPTCRSTLSSAGLHRAGLGVRAGGNIEGLKGSTLRLDAVTTKDCRQSGNRHCDDGKKMPLKIDGRKIPGQSRAVSVAALSHRRRRRVWLSQLADHLRAARQAGRLSRPSICCSPPKIWKSTATRFLPWNTARATISASPKSIWSPRSASAKTRLGCRKTTPSGSSCAINSNGTWANSALREDEEAVFMPAGSRQRHHFGPKIGTARSLRLAAEKSQGRAPTGGRADPRFEQPHGRSLGRPPGNAAARRQKRARRKDNEQKLEQNSRRRAQAHRRGA